MSCNRDESECASLVPRGESTMSYTDEGGSILKKSNSQGEQASQHDQVDFVDTSVPIMSQFHEDAIQQAGFGTFQWILLAVLGLGLAGDTIELFVVAYVIPSAEVELCMTSVQKGWLGAITFVGMMIGGIVWGILADKMGRRRTLLSSLTVNAVFGIISAFMPTYGTFMTTRLCSGIGIGGSLPIVFAYYCEFLPKIKRGRHLSWLLMFWAVGGVFVALMAWCIIPRTGIKVVENEKLHFSSWREFLLICAIPSILSLGGLIFMPESPRFLLEMGRDVEAIGVYQKIHKKNHSRKPGCEYRLTELELPSKPACKEPYTSGPTSFMSDVSNGLEQFWNAFMQLFIPPYLANTIILLLVWFTAAFGYYGLSIWFPEYIKLLTNEHYDAKAKLIDGANYTQVTFNNTLDNTNFEKSLFRNVSFEDMVLNHVTFTNCIVEDCLFTDVLTSRTYFYNSTILRTTFIDTNFLPFRFQDCDLQDNKFISTSEACRIDFDFNIHLKEIFLENLIGQLAIIPGNVFSAIIMDRVGRVKTICVSMFLSGLSAFFIWFLNTKISVIVFEAAFNLIFISGWNAIDVATTETYPTHLRTTGYGFLSAVCRVAGILGNLTFGSYIGINKAIPMLTTAAVLIVGSIISIKIPETSESLI